MTLAMIADDNGTQIHPMLATANSIAYAAEQILTSEWLHNRVVNLFLANEVASWLQWLIGLDAAK